MVCPHCGTEFNLEALARVEAQCDFDSFYACYPKHRARADALRAWKQTEKIRPALSVILAAIAAQRMTPEWMKEGGTFVPLPASWLRGERWADEVSTQTNVSTRTARTLALLKESYDI